MKKEYITIAELAKRCGVSRQAIYRRKHDLQQFTKVVDSKTLVSTEAESLFMTTKVSSADKNTVNLDNPAIFLLQAQLEEKDRQISKLQDQNAKQAETITKLSLEVAEITKQAQELTRNSQILLASEKHIERLEAVSGTSAVNSSDLSGEEAVKISNKSGREAVDTDELQAGRSGSEAAENNTFAGEAQAETPKSGTGDEQVKNGFFKRLFKGKSAAGK